MKRFIKHALIGLGLRADDEENLMGFATSWAAVTSIFILCFVTFLIYVLWNKLALI